MPGGAPECLKLWRASRLPGSLLKMGSPRLLLPLRRKALPFLMHCHTTSADMVETKAGGCAVALPAA